MAKKRGKARHPIQPLITMPDGVIRFKANKIVQFLLNSAPTGARNDLNSLACMGFSDDDWEQFAQLIGYSLSGWGSLSYVSDRAWSLASTQEFYGKQKDETVNGRGK